jgi:hypothetical protein
MTEYSITIKCCCGTEAIFRDDRQNYIHGGGKPDKEGRVFQLELLVDKFLDKHNTCATFRGRK